MSNPFASFFTPLLSFPLLFIASFYDLATLKLKMYFQLVFFEDGVKGIKKMLEAMKILLDLMMILSTSICTLSDKLIRFFGG